VITKARDVQEVRVGPLVSAPFCRACLRGKNPTAQLAGPAGNCTHKRFSLTLPPLDSIRCFFFRFTAEESVSSTAQIKASIARGIRASVLEQMPGTPSTHIDFFYFLFLLLL
jgi:hypothetical protein